MKTLSAPLNRVRSMNFPTPEDSLLRAMILLSKRLPKLIQKELPQLEVALTEQDADFFILCNLTDSTTNAAVTNDRSNPNLFGDFIVFMVVLRKCRAEKNPYPFPPKSRSQFRSLYRIRRTLRSLKILPNN